MKRKFAFTLVELLAVIVILAVILAIAVPSIINLVSNSRIDAFTSNGKLVFKAIDYKRLSNNAFDPTAINVDNVNSQLNIGDEDYESISIMNKNNDLFLVIIGKNKWNDLVIYGTRNNLTVVTRDQFNQSFPVITIIGNNPISIDIGSVYTDAGATASDNVDGDITNEITITGSVNTNVIGTYAITYSVTNSLGNTTTLTRTVNVIDNIPPVIIMLGNNPITIDLGSTYIDAGATASDNIDGDITSSIVVTSTVNTNVEGSYTVTYNVSDTAGNVAIPVVRTINVLALDYAGPKYIPSKGVNGPVLSVGMTPIKWDGSTWVDTTITDSDWYDYNIQNWANAKTADGSFWVWIPRYIYKISSGPIMNIQFTKGTIDNWNSEVIGAINTDTSANASNNTWTNEPAFTFGSTELTGFWIAKFEASNTGSNVVKIIPNVKAWIMITPDNIFTYTRNMEINNTYGWGTSGMGIDTHMMKNVEWGAVAYLSRSQYGKYGNNNYTGTNKEVYINNNNGSYTGCSGGSPNAALSVLTNACNNTGSYGYKYDYMTNNYGIGASTTGTIYGIYDMSGGAYEYVAAYIGTSPTNGTSIISALDQYKDMYSVGVPDNQTNNYALTINHKGDAIHETNAWYSDSAGMPFSTNYWFARGGYNASTSLAGMFAYGSSQGQAINPYGFRPVLMVNAGL